MKDKFKESYFGDPEQKPPLPPIRFKDLETKAKVMLSSLLLFDLLMAGAWAAAFSQINHMFNDLFVANAIPFLEFLGNLTFNSILSFILGLNAVIIPAVAFHFIIRDEIMNDIKGYFENNVQRIFVATLLAVTWSLIISLEIFSLTKRVEAVNVISPIPSLDEPNLIPMYFISAILILGSALLGLASASLTNSIRKRHIALHSQS